MIVAVVSIAVVAVFACLYLAAIAAYHKETNSRQALLRQGEPETPDYMDVEIKVTAFDPVKDSMDLRIGFRPNGNLESGSQTSKEICLITNSSTGSSERVLPKNQFMSSMDITIETDGTVSDYPWDKHEGLLLLAMETREADGREDPLVMRITFTGSLAGLRLYADLSKESNPSMAIIRTLTQRSTVIKVVVSFSMFLLWVLTATVLAMVIAVLIGNKIEMVMFPFIGTILFSMIAFRNALPGAPPIGAVSDYLAFFWGYSLCILALLALTVIWLKRLPRKPKVLGAPPDAGAGLGSPEEKRVD